MLSTIYGCPFHPGIKWETGSISLIFPEDSVSWTQKLHIPGPIGHNYVKWNLCKAHIDGNVSINWSKGDYCILQSGVCPAGKY
jgi:hypothetical protein